MVQFYFKITLLFTCKCYPSLSMARMDRMLQLIFSSKRATLSKKKTQERSRYIFLLIESVDIFFPQNSKNDKRCLRILSCNFSSDLTKTEQRTMTRDTAPPPPSTHLFLFRRLSLSFTLQKVNQLSLL